MAVGNFKHISGQRRTLWWERRIPGVAMIAVATGAPVGTVRSRLHRARRHMRLGLEKTKFDLGDLTGERSRT